MILIKICYSIAKKNKGFSICLFLTSFLCVVIAILGANFARSARNSFDDFLYYHGAPEILVTTYPFEDNHFADISDIDGVSEISSRMIFGFNLETSDGLQFSGDLLTFDENGPLRLAVHDKCDIESSLPRVSLYYKFADYNNIKPGDIITLTSSLGSAECIVEATVSSPETLGCAKDELSNREQYQFWYAYMDRDSYDECFNTRNIINSILVYLEDGLSSEAQQSILNEITNTYDKDILYSAVIKETKGYEYIQTSIRTLNTMCIAIPVVVMLVSLGFSFIFVKIIVGNQKKTISLLKSLGYSSGKVVFIFILFTFLINTLSLIPGIPAGRQVLKFCVSLIIKSEGIPSITFAYSYPVTIGLIALVFIIGFLVSLSTSKSICNIDPSLVSSSSNDYTEVPKFVSRIKCNPFVKLSIISSLKDYKRLIVGSLSLALCIVFMCIGFEGYLTNSNGADEVFGDRYDLMVRDISEDNYAVIEKAVSGTDRIEPVSLFTEKIGDTKVNVSSVCEGSKLIVPKDKDGNVLSPGNGVIIDEMYEKLNDVHIGDSIMLGDNEITITGVAREIICPFFYISSETAREKYGVKTNCAMIKISADSSVEEVKKQITDINGYAYFTLMSLQYENLVDGARPVRLSMFIFAVLAFILGSLLVFNMAIIDFNEKKGKYATFRALGTSVNKLCLISLVENLMRLIPGVILAIPTSYGATLLILSLISNADRQYINVKFGWCLLSAIFISVLYLVSSLLISHREIRKMDFVEKLNEVE